MMMILEVILWLLIAAGFHSMFGYPLLMWLVSKVYRKTFIREPITPLVSQIIAAYNEEKAIKAKLENSLSFDYPPDKLEIIVVSDGSTDRTDEIVRTFEPRGVKLVRVEGGRGKATAINEAVKKASGEILAMSDATGMWSPGAIRAMAAHFADPRVGCVSGRVTYSYDKSATAKGFGAYQRFVTALRQAEASFGTGFNAPGSIHTVRRSAFMPGPPATFGDMVDPYHTAIQGLRTTYEHEATSLEESRTSIGDEYQARLRICLRAWTFLFYALARFPLFKNPMYCFQLVSHKFLRWTIGPSLVPIFVINALLLGRHWCYQILFGGQLAWWLLTLIAYLASKMGRRIPGLSGLLFFNSVNLAYLWTLILYLCGVRVARWRPSR